MLETHVNPECYKAKFFKSCSEHNDRDANREIAELTNLPPAFFANQHVAIAGTEKQRFVRMWFVVTES